MSGQLVIQLKDLDVANFLRDPGQVRLKFREDLERTSLAALHQSFHSKIEKSRPRTSSSRRYGRTESERERPEIHDSCAASCGRFPCCQESPYGFTRSSCWGDPCQIALCITNLPYKRILFCLDDHPDSNQANVVVVILIHNCSSVLTKIQIAILNQIDRQTTRTILAAYTSRSLRACQGKSQCFCRCSSNTSSLLLRIRGRTWTR